MKEKITSEEYARRGKIGRKAQDEWLIKKFGNISDGLRGISNREKAKETFKKNYWANPDRQEKNRQQLKEAQERAKLPSSRQKRLATYQRIGHSQGQKNSQFGTCWIYNEHGNKKIKKVELDTYLQQGYIRGRKL
jgi:hypothetical protein